MTYSSPVPVGSRIGSNFGQRSGGFHAGDDYPPPRTGQQGVPVYAIEDGVVIGDGANLLKGHSGDRNVLIQHAGGVLSYYGHLNTNNVAKGDKVKAGEKIGEMGYRGNVYPPGKNGTHLHLGIIVNGKFVDPSEFLASKRISVGKTKPVTPKASSTPTTSSSSTTSAKTKAWQKRQNFYGRAGLLVDGVMGSKSKAWKKWVEETQKAVNNYNGVRGEVVADGDYGPSFNSQVREVQKRNGLHQDGIVGPVMIKWLKAHGSKVSNRP